MKFSLNSLIQEISGLNPKSILILENGWVREEWKSLCFGKGKSITAQAIQNPKQWAQALVPESQTRLLDRPTRVQLLKQSFKDPNLKEALPKLNEHRFRPNFFESLERSLSKGRELFAHAEEAKVLELRLNEKVGFEERREEFFLLNFFWERVLSARDLWDDARLFEVASERLGSETLSFPFQKIYRLKHFQETPRLQLFWEQASKNIEIVTLAVEDLVQFAPILLDRKLAHSLEDGAQTLFDEILKTGFDHQAIVIEDRPVIRRTLKRLARERGFDLLDPRDPTLFLQSEEVKTALLELELTSRNFKSQLVLSWVGAVHADPGPIRRKIIEFGIVDGLNSYQNIPDVYLGLKTLKEKYPNRLTLTELSTAIEGSCQKLGLRSWVRQSLQKIIDAWRISLNQIGEENRKRPLRYWLEEFKKRIESSPPLVNPLKNELGLKLFRVDQAVSIDLLARDHQIHFFGVSPQFFESRVETSTWFSKRDIEALSSEFAIPSVREKEAQAKTSFCSWVSISRDPAVFWEYTYDEMGGEQESLEMILASIPDLKLGVPEFLPVHPHILPSLSSKLKSPASIAQIHLDRTEFSVSFLNSLGNCAFTAYAQALLSLYDERDPDYDLSGDTFGNLVHAAVEALVSSKLAITPEQAFEEAWMKTAKLAWLKSDRLFRALKRKTISILENFLESEKEYRLRSGAEVIAQESSIELKRSGFTFKGRMDRIDQHADGIVLIDYKTSGVLPSGKETIEKLKGLQLPAYALALKEKMNQEVVGAQYLQLGTHKTNRNLGFLFSNWNKGKAADKIEFPISTARGNSNSLIVGEPEAIWAELDQKIKDLLEKVKGGEFKAEPNDPKECERCRYSVVCGRKRGFSEVVSEESP